MGCPARTSASHGSFMNDNGALLTSPWRACGELLNQLIEFAPKPGTHEHLVTQLPPRGQGCPHTQPACERGVTADRLAWGWSVLCGGVPEVTKGD